MSLSTYVRPADRDTYESLLGEMTVEAAVGEAEFRAITVRYAVGAETPEDASFGIRSARSILTQVASVMTDDYSYSDADVEAVGRVIQRCVEEYGLIEAAFSMNRDVVKTLATPFKEASRRPADDPLAFLQAYRIAHREAFGEDFTL